MTDAVTMILSGMMGMCLLMLILWLVHLAIRNAGIVDAGWAGGLVLLGIYYAIAGHGYPPRSILMAAMSGIYGMRLAYYLLVKRVIGQPEEGRYF
jgi:steroid 5-alpha reductase family enzyme